MTTVETKKTCCSHECCDHPKERVAQLTASVETALSERLASEPDKKIKLCRIDKCADLDDRWDKISGAVTFPVQPDDLLRHTPQVVDKIMAFIGKHPDGNGLWVWMLYGQSDDAKDMPTKLCMTLKTPVDVECKVAFRASEAMVCDWIRQMIALPRPPTLDSVVFHQDFSEWQMFCQNMEPQGKWRVIKQASELQPQHDRLLVCVAYIAKEPRSYWFTKEIDDAKEWTVYRYTATSTAQFIERSVAFEDIRLRSAQTVALLLEGSTYHIASEPKQQQRPLSELSWPVQKIDNTYVFHWVWCPNTTV